MIKSNSDDKSVISVNLEKEYFIPSDINSILISSLQICEGELIKFLYQYVYESN